MDQRENCFHCGEAILLTARICPHCKESALVDVKVETPMLSGRASYEAARKLSQLADAGLDFLTAKRRLDSPPTTVVSSITRERARDVVAVLSEQGTIPKIVSSDGMASDQNANSKTVWIGRLSVKHLMMAAIGVLSFAVLFLVSGLPELGGGSGARGSADLDMRRLAELVESSTVHLRCRESVGAGFFVQPDLVVTNEHVLCRNTSEIEVVFANGSKAKGKRIEADKWLDVGIIRVVGADAPSLKLGDASVVERGDRVVLMGSPQGLDFSFSQGFIGHPERVIGGVSYLQVDAAVNPGNSGGPLLNAAGEVIGVVSMKAYGASGLGLALPINYLVTGAEPLLQNSEIELNEQQWADRLETADFTNREQVEAFRAQQGQVELIGARMTRHANAVVAIVSQWSEARPSAAKVEFVLVSKEGVHLCRPNGVVREWRRFSVAKEKDAIDPRWLMWLERNDLTSNFFVGSAHLDMGYCPGPRLVLGSSLVFRIDGDREQSVEITMEN